MQGIYATFSLKETGCRGVRGAFYPEISKPTGFDYSRVLVVPKLASEDVSWIFDELPGLESAIYEVENPSAKLRVSKSKGHEAMTYIPCIIDYYDGLPDTIIFVHAHETAWHKNVLLNLDASTTIKRLRDDRVSQQGYMNLRCHHDSGTWGWGINSEENLTYYVLPPCRMP